MKTSDCARCRLPFDQPGKGRRRGVALNTPDGPVHFPGCINTEDRILDAIVHLKRARLLLLAAGAIKTRERVRLAISSAKGAARHAVNKSARARFDRRS